MHHTPRRDLTGAPVRPVVAVTTGAGDYQLQVLKGITATLAPHRIPVMAVSVEVFGSTTPSTVVLDLVRRQAVLGVIVFGDASDVSPPELPDVLRATGTPTVTISSPWSGFPRVRGDNRSGMRHLMAHLLDERGVRRPALVRGIPGHPDSDLREAIFRAECAARGVPVDDGLVVDGCFQPNTAYDAVRGMLRSGRTFEALVAANDFSALGAVCALNDHGLRIPEDVLVAGFDNSSQSTQNWPPLTTVDQHLDEQGSLAADLLLKVVSGDRSAGEVHVPSDVVVRVSTSPDAIDLDDVLSVARIQQGHVMQQMGQVVLSRTLVNSHSVDDVIRATAPTMAQVGLRHCYVTLDTSPQQGDVAAAAAPRDPALRPMTLQLDYHDEVVAAPTGETFPRWQLLPPSLRPQLFESLMIVQPLAIGGHERGYMVHDVNLQNPWYTAELYMDLVRNIGMVLTAQELREHASGLEELVARRTRELEEANAALERSVLRDPLTGIANRKAFQQFLAESFAPGGCETGHLALFMVDIDEFKAYNDHYGHLAGDDTLATVADCLHRSMPERTALACRYGGEEFVAVLRDRTVEEAEEVATRFRGLLARAHVPHDASSVADVVTVSIGVAESAAGPGSDPAVLVMAADQALYEAKLRGRDRIVRDSGHPRMPLQRAVEHR